MLTAHEILRFRKRQASMRIHNLTPWRRSRHGGWAWTLELEDDDGIWRLSSDGSSVQLCRRGSRGMVAIGDSLWQSVLVSHRAAILAAMTEDLAWMLRTWTSFGKPSRSSSGSAASAAVAARDLDDVRHWRRNDA